MKAWLASFLALAVPVDSNRQSRAGAESLAPLPPNDDVSTDLGGPSYGTARFTTLKAGWPAAAPELANDDENRAWELVFKHCERYGIEDKALLMFRTIWHESRCQSGAKSRCGRYYGIAQFVKSTFTKNVKKMKALGYVAPDAAYSPLDTDQAMEVMAFMWSQGYERHWGPYARHAKRWAKEMASRPVVVAVN
ncbi:MAG: hypothetical protein JNK60_01720 [Acidobacteria bacterium]|nr:hypothetical protein [Acidobacteriota bacterium]